MGLHRRLGSLALVAIMVAGCTTEDASDEAPVAAEDAPGWAPVAASPLSPRAGALAFWTGAEVLVVGGSDDASCPPDADCATPPAGLADGAAYDPASDTWREIAAAPLAPGFASGTVAAGRLYLWVPPLLPPLGGEPTFLEYDPAADAWTRLEPPPAGDPGGLTLSAADGRVVAAVRSHESGLGPDLVYDPGTGAWSELPPDPVARAFDRTIVWTDAGLVVTGIPLVRHREAADPPFYAAARLADVDGVWERLPDSEVVGWSPTWWWSGGRVVNPSLGASDGGTVNAWERPYPHGGLLDPAAGTWGPLPDIPAERGRLTGLSTAGAEWVVSIDGAALHVRSGTWMPLDPPVARFPTDGHAATWAGDQLFVWGGSAIANDGQVVLTDDGWRWRPP